MTAEWNFSAVKQQVIGDTQVLCYRQVSFSVLMEKRQHGEEETSGSTGLKEGAASLRPVKSSKGTLHIVFRACTHEMVQWSFLD